MATKRAFKIRPSVYIKKLILKIINDNNLSISLISTHLGVKYEVLVMWFNASNGGKDTSGLPEEKISELCKILGIKIQISYVVCKIPEGSLDDFKNKAIAESVRKRKEKYDKDIEEYFNDEED